MYYGREERNKYIVKNVRQYKPNNSISYIADNNYNRYDDPHYRMMMMSAYNNYPISEGGESEDDDETVMVPYVQPAAAEPRVD